MRHLISNPLLVLFIEMIDDVIENISEKEIQVLKSVYFEEFSHHENGPLHCQHWVVSDAYQFHRSMADFKQFFCTNCHEMWPTTLGFCKQCKDDRIMFSENNCYEI